jgi:hypothetical protein
VASHRVVGHDATTTFIYQPPTLEILSLAIDSAPVSTIPPHHLRASMPIKKRAKAMIDDSSGTWPSRTAVTTAYTLDAIDTERLL